MNEELLERVANAVIQKLGPQIRELQHIEAQIATIEENLRYQQRWNRRDNGRR